MRKSNPVRSKTNSRQWKRSACALLLAAACGFAGAQAPSKPEQARKPIHHRLKAAEPVAQAPAPVQPPPPPRPNWPVNDAPVQAKVNWDSKGLSIDASNSSLHQILNQVATATGAKVEGFGSDERVFGDYGPGEARDVLSQLLHGTGYNVLLIGDQGQGTPREIVLSARNENSKPAPGLNPPGMDRPAPDNPEDDDNQPPPVIDEQQPMPPVNNRGPMNLQGPRTPQQIMLEMQQRQQELQRQQQQNNPPPQ